MLRLSSKWADFLKNQPESGMGFQVGKVILKDGRTFGHVVIVEGNVTLVDGGKAIPFSDDDIDKITLTHEKWDKYGKGI